MRNLKRALSLLLSSTMVLGMLVMGSSAESYKDVDRADNQEAIEVLQAVGIMTGDENGNFNPDKTVTRNEMAVIMSQLLNLDYDYYRGTNPFTDVPDWAAPYVAACAAEGVVAGIGNGLYGGNNTVTAAQASLMIMKALGYFQNAEDFGSDWQVATIRQASYIDLFDGINANAETALTRNQIAQLVLNGLKSDMVYFTGDMGIQIGDVTVGYKGEYTVRTSSDKKYNTLVGGTTDIVASDKYTIQLGEELYNGKLTERSATDAFERPATTWRYDNSDIGTYADEPDASYTAGVKIGTIYNDLGLTKGIADEDTTVYEDGRLVDGLTHDAWTKYDIVKGQTAKIGGNGALTEVYYNDEDNTATIIVSNTYVAKVNAAYAETSTRDAYVTLNVADNFTGPGGTFETDEFAKDDIVAYTYSYKSGETGVQSMKLTEKVAGTMSTYTTSGSVTVDGTKYDANTASATKIAGYIPTVDKSQEVAVYLDEYGYALYVDADTDVQYAVILNYNATAGDWNDTAKAKLLFTDGTVKTVEVKMNSVVEGSALFDGFSSNKISAGDIVAYTVDSDEVYTLTLKADTAYATKASSSSSPVALVTNGINSLDVDPADKGGIAAADTVNRVDGKTIFLICDKTGSKDVYSVYEGFATVPTIKNSNTSGNQKVAVFAEKGSNTPATVVYIELVSGMTMSSDNKDVIFVKGSNVGTSYNTELGTFYEYDAFINGEATTIKVDTNNQITSDALIYGPHYNAKGVLNGADARVNWGTDTTTTTVNGLTKTYGTDSVVNDVIKLGNTHYAYNSDVNVYFVTVDGELVKSDITAISEDSNDQVYLKVDDKGLLTDVYVRVVDTPETVTPGVGNNLKNLSVAKNGVGLRVNFQFNAGTYENNHTATAVFYQVKGGVSYELGTATYTGPMGATASYLDCPNNPSETGTYYAVVTIYDNTGAQVDSATTAQANLAF